jgi:hypothetical protein
MPTIRWLGKPPAKPPPEPPPSKRKPKAKPRLSLAKLPAPVRAPEPPPEPSIPLTPLSAADAPHGNRNGHRPGRALKWGENYANLYAVSRTCVCDRPMVIADPDTRIGPERLGPRCQHCGKPVAG